jgi:hypothetical protein
MESKSFWNKCCHVTIGNTSIIETVGVLLTIYVPPRVPFFIG